MRLSRKTRCRIREAFGLRRVHRRFFLFTAEEHSTFNIQRRTSKGRPTLTLPVMPLLRPWVPAADQDRINQMNKMPKPKDFIL